MHRGLHSAYSADRAVAKAALSSGSLHEVYVKADLALCEARNPKCLYAKARRDELPEFTGIISAPCEGPDNPELVIDTAQLNLHSCLEQSVRYVLTRVPLSYSTPPHLVYE